MTYERPAPQIIPGEDPRQQNGTGEQADEEQLGIPEEEVEELEEDAKGG